MIILYFLIFPVEKAAHTKDVNFHRNIGGVITYSCFDAVQFGVKMFVEAREREREREREEANWCSSNLRIIAISKYVTH